MNNQEELPMKKRKGFYSISVVAKMFSVHQQTIRMYEKEGLINPRRSDGNTRLFSEEDVARLEEVIYLTHKLGVNLAGVEIILKLQKKVKRMQEEMNKMFESAQKNLEEEGELFKQDLKQQVGRLVKIKQEAVLQKKSQKFIALDVEKKKKEDDDDDVNDISFDYEYDEK
jgi:MerR family transcriptional regulator/heat shock protein HspR